MEISQISHPGAFVLIFGAMMLRIRRGCEICRRRGAIGVESKLAG